MKGCRVQGLRFGMLRLKVQGSGLMTSSQFNNQVSGIEGPKP